MSEEFHKYIPKEQFKRLPSDIKFKTYFDNCISQALLKRGYKRTQDNDWDIYWCEKHLVSHALDQVRLFPTKKINHFRNYYQLCRKDLMAKNIKKYKKALQKQGKKEEANSYDFIPVTYTLPSQYPTFQQEFKRSKDEKLTWIMKPIGSSQGKGIFLFKHLSEISDWADMSNQADPYVVQRYIHNPLLVGNKKFDLRIYVFVLSHNPLVVYLYRSGFARFTHCKYEESNLTMRQGHLPNVYIQKQSKNYDEERGGKYQLHKLKQYLLSRYPEEQIQMCFWKIQQLIIKTLQTTSKVINNDKKCFQLYGFDILIDSSFKPWLLEVNGSPSMTHNTTVDQQLKMGLLDDIFTILNFEGLLTGNEEQVGGFDLIFKEKRITPSGKFISRLGTKNNRQEQLRKLGKITAMRNVELLKKQSQKRRGKSLMQAKQTLTGTRNKILQASTRKRIPPPGQNKSFNISVVKRPLNSQGVITRPTQSRDNKA